MPYDPKCPACGKANLRPDLAGPSCNCARRDNRDTREKGTSKMWNMFGMFGEPCEPGAGEKALRRAMPRDYVPTWPSPVIPADGDTPGKNK